LDVCIRAWIHLFSKLLYKVLSIGKLRKLLTDLAGFDLPEYATFAQRFQKKEKLDIFPYDTKRTVAIRKSKCVFPETTIFNQNQPHRQTIFLQILLWSRLSQPSCDALRGMMKNLSCAPNLKPDQADRILWNFFHSVVDEVSLSKPIWAYGFFCVKENKKHKKQAAYQPVQHNPHSVQHFCLLLSAVERCASAFTEWSNKSSKLQAVQASFFEQKALSQNDFPDHGNIPTDLWKNIVDYYTSFLGNDGFTFLTVAHSLYLRLHLDYFYRFHSDQLEIQFYKEKFHSLFGDVTDVFDSNSFCPFGNPETQIHCAGYPLLDFLSVANEVVFDDLKRFVLEFTHDYFRKKLEPFLLASQGGALPVSKDSQGRVGLEAIKATIDGGQTADQNTTTEVQPQLLPLPLGQLPAHGTPHGTPDPADLNNPPPGPPLHESKTRSTRKKQGGEQTLGKQGGEQTLGKQDSQTRKKRSQTKEKQRKSVTGKGTGKGKPSLDQVDIGMENVREIYKFSNLLKNNNNRLIPSIDQYLKFVPHKHEHSIALMELKHHIQFVVKLVQPLKNPKTAKLQHAILEGEDDNECSTSGKAQSVLLTTVRNIQQHDESYDQEIAFHHTAEAGIGADDAPSDPEPEDDSKKPYQNHPFIDDEAKEGGENDDDLDYNTSAGYNDTKADTEDDTDLDSCDQLDPDQLDPLSLDDEMEKILEAMRLSPGENFALDTEFDGGQVRCRGPGRGEAEAEAV
jgi:hypothetical protein